MFLIHDFAFPRFEKSLFCKSFFCIGCTTVHRSVHPCAPLTHKGCTTVHRSVHPCAPAPWRPCAPLRAPLCTA